MKFTEKYFGGYLTYEKDDLDRCLPDSFLGLIAYMLIGCLLTSVAVGLFLFLCYVVGEILTFLVM